MIGERITKSRLDLDTFKATACPRGGTHEPRVHFELDDRTPGGFNYRGSNVLALGARYIACCKCKERPARVPGARTRKEGAMRIKNIVVALALLIVAAACGDSPTGVEPTEPPATAGIAMSIVAGQGQVGPVATTLPTPLTVQVVVDTATSQLSVLPYGAARSMTQIPVPGRPVNFRVVEGPQCGVPYAGVAITDSLGLAADLWDDATLAGVPCHMEARAVTSAGEPIVYETFEATFLAGPARKFDLATTDTMLIEGEALVVGALVSNARDQYDNAANADTVTLSSVPAFATASGDTLHVHTPGAGNVTVKVGSATQVLDVTSLTDLNADTWEIVTTCYDSFAADGADSMHVTVAVSGFVYGGNGERRDYVTVHGTAHEVHFTGGAAAGVDRTFSTHIWLNTDNIEWAGGGGFADRDGDAYVTRPGARGICAWRDWRTAGTTVMRKVSN